MKKLLLIIILMLLFASSLIAQYNSVGYDAKRGQWNVLVHEYSYWHDSNNPSLIHSFNWEIENKTAYTIVAIDIEFSLYQKGKLFYKKLMYITISPGANPGEYVLTDKWRLATEISKSKFDKNTTWSATVKNVYVPKNN